ncbi:MAG: ATP synthase F0 subcomplex subunit OSCP atp5 [Sclerophora amabilis]|nr:MAG: ATP synthase F0 subcomplex subunit OSCP atp5 [Sclerophora amabilis]
MLSSRAALQACRASAPRAGVARRVLAAPPSRKYAQAAPASSESSTKPPVALYGVDGTYASALYTAAAKTSSLDSVAKALSLLSAVFKKDTKLPGILRTPTLTASDKSQIVTELQRHTGSVDKGDTVKSFLNTLAANNRLGVLESVCEKFQTLMGAYRGEVELTVTSAAPLENRMLSRIESAISKSEYVGQGKKLKVTNTVNPDILGGLVVEIAGRTIDLSVSSKLVKMNKLLTDTL